MWWNLLYEWGKHFFIFSRSNENFSENTDICCISKELESARKFISFGVLEKNDNDKYCFKNLKKHEIQNKIII